MKNNHHRIDVALGERSYPVILSHQGFTGLGNALKEVTERRRVLLLTEDTVGPIWASNVLEELTSSGFSVEVITLPSGEVNKTVDTWALAVDSILRAGVDRNTPILALGGGVLGDIVGFAAAASLRGMPFVQLPTTLLSMVDSSVGGKTGVNHHSGKNLVGAFHQPILVFAAISTLSTLDAVERNAGLGEVVKTALLGDAELFAYLESNRMELRNGDEQALAHVIGRCVQAKAAIVAADEKESGIRALLNAGHTVGHGIENSAGYGVIRHGEAVAIGLIYEAAFAVREGVCFDEDLPLRLRSIVSDLGLPVALPTLDHSDIVTAMHTDKKAAGGVVKVPLPVRVGEMRMVLVPFEQLHTLLSEFE
jgi:3-dehydroquinate synthase